MKNNYELDACGLSLDISRQRLSDSQWKEATAVQDNLWYEELKRIKNIIDF